VCCALTCQTAKPLPPGFTTRVRRLCLPCPRKNAGGAERRWTLPSERDPHRKPTGSEPIGAGGMRPGAVSDNTRAHARRRSTAQTGLRRLRCFCGVFCPRTVSDKPAMRRLSPCVRSGHGGHLWRAPRSGSRTVDRGLPGVIASHAQAPHHTAALANPRRLIRPRFNPTCRSIHRRRRACPVPAASGRSANRTPHDDAPGRARWVQDRWNRKIIKEGNARG
jgi:hypothetical protein